jgi:Xaa-Pro dipeptidase
MYDPRQGGPAFAPEEFERRQTALRALMAERKLDALMLCAPENLYYLTGFDTTGFHSFFQALFFLKDGPSVIVTRHLEAPVAENTGYKVRGVGYQDKEPAGEKTVATLKELGLEAKTIGVEKDVPWFRVRVYDALREGAPRARFEDISGLVETLRTVKSEPELAYMRLAGKATTAGALAAIDAVREGALDSDVAAASFPARINAGSHFVRTPSYIVSGPRSAIAHQNWNGSRIEKGDVVYFEIGSNVRRYSSPCMRTVSVGKPSDIVRRAADATIEGLTRAVEAVKPGARVEDVHKANYRVLEKAGLMEYFRHRTGYSIGIEFLLWLEHGGVSVNWESPVILKPGMTFHFVPLVLIPGVGGIGFSEAIACTATGHELFNRVPREMVIK